ncbi:MAG: hypothetical protein WCP03_01540 [Candidatus Saccharibacteria bacterium]
MVTVSNNKWQKYLAVTIVVIAIIGLGKLMWLDQIYLKPQNVFWGMINQNLQTGSITKTVVQKNNDLQSIQQVTSIQYKSEIYARTVVTIQDKTKGNESLIITDTYGTPTQDFLKYKTIKSAGNNTPKNVEGVWSVNTASSQQQVQILSDAILSSPLIFGYLNSNKRTDLINQMHFNSVFNIDYSAVNKNDKVDGKKAYSYKLTIDLAKYMSVYRNYLSMIGQGNLAGQLGQPQAGATYKATLYVNALNRQPLRLVPEGVTTGEGFSNIDSNNITKPPKDAKLSILQLQNRLSNQP